MIWENERIKNEMITFDRNKDCKDSRDFHFERNVLLKEHKYLLLFHRIVYIFQFEITRIIIKGPIFN